MAEYRSHLPAHSVADPSSKLVAEVSADGLSVTQITPGANLAFASVTITADTGSHNILGGQAGFYTRPYFLVIANSSNTATEVTISDGTNSLPIYVPAGSSWGFCNDKTLPATAINTAWTATCTTGVTSIKVFGFFYLSTTQ